MGHVHIKHLSGSKAGLIEQFILDNPEGLCIGRGSKANVKYDNDGSVSRLHARIVCDADPKHGYRITDLGSTNGTYVNDKQLTSGISLVSGDRVRLGLHGPEFQFEVDSEPQPPQFVPPIASEQRPIRGTVIAGAKELVDEFFVLGEKKNFIALFFKILPSPTNETMRIVNKEVNVSPFRFMEFGYAVLAITKLSEPLLEGEPNLADEVIDTLLMLVFFLVFTTVQYKILRDVSHANRTFHSYLAMCAIIGGMAWLLLGLAQVVAQVSQIFGGLLMIGASIYSFTHNLRTSKRFWNMSYGRVFLYSFLSAIAGSIVLLVLAALLGITLGAFFGID